MECREGLCPFSGLWVLVDKNLLLGGLRQKPDAGWNLDKIEINPVSVFRVFDLLFIHTKPYENEFSTALSECKAVGPGGPPEKKNGEKKKKINWNLRNCGLYIKVQNSQDFQSKIPKIFNLRRM